MIKKIQFQKLSSIESYYTAVLKINELVDAVNELKGAKNE